MFRVFEDPSDLESTSWIPAHSKTARTGPPAITPVPADAGRRSTTPAAIAKGVEEAKKSFFRVPRVGNTIPHPVQGEAAAGVVLLRPASAGTGVIAGGPVRAILECAGIHDVLSKSLGSSNTLNIVHATVAALRQLEEPSAVAARRGLSVEEVVPAGLLREQRKAVS